MGQYWGSAARPEAARYACLLLHTKLYCFLRFGRLLDYTTYHIMIRVDYEMRVILSQQSREGNRHDNSH